MPDVSYGSLLLFTALRPSPFLLFLYKPPYVTIPPTILFVDDDADDTFLFREVLAEVDPALGFASAANGEEALDKLSRSDGRLPDLIFMDLNMPRMNGRECLAAIKASDRLRHIPVIMYTTSSYGKDKEDVLNSGAAFYITKPANYADLKSILSVVTQHISDLPRAYSALSSLTN